MATQPRGVRNNNPLNIEYSKHNDWNGQTGHDGRYAIFSNPVYGFRAAAKLITNYRHKYGITTLGAVLKRWAPKHENPTRDYIAFVANRAGLTADSEVTSANLVSVLGAMAEFENGGQYFDTDVISQGVALV
ncbi:hypothetical protein [Salinivibrio sp. IB872]|uniref:hypothetical protein n=1 Tax=Salinivibrio sp. IB872 TaxID=1766123 RepID=UPI0009877B94|nr:hypothetical protein [Salinivibrio sp. IB872]OOF25719.1 hypothetical protein BZJ18_10940 [Salinivibrio sp. IB872]